MLLNFDRQRLLIIGGVGIVLILILGFYHAPDYVPQGVGRMKTSVSTWLKGQEPSLDDEMYKDHFSPPIVTPTEPFSEHTTQAAVNYADTIAKGDVMIQPIDHDDDVDILIPSEAPAPANTKLPSPDDKKLPAAHDFMNNLPDPDLLSSIALATADVPSAVVHTKFITLTQSALASQPSAETPHEQAFDADKWYLEEEEKD